MGCCNLITGAVSELLDPMVSSPSLSPCHAQLLRSLYFNENIVLELLTANDTSLLRNLNFKEDILLAELTKP